MIKKDDNYHYCWIKDLSWLLSEQLSKHYDTRFICRYCLKSCLTEKILDEHKKNCIEDSC